MEVKRVPSLLEERQEYTYEQAFRLYDEIARVSCEQDNQEIARKNAIEKSAIDARNVESRRVAELKNDEMLKKVEEENSKRIAEAKSKRVGDKKKRHMIIWGVSFFLSLFAAFSAEKDSIFNMFFFMANLLFWGYIINYFVKYTEYAPELLKYEAYSPKEEQFSPIPNVSYTFIPSGVIQCSSCATKTRLDNKNENSKCPNCGSEIFVVSKMESNVTIKSIARSDTA